MPAAVSSLAALLVSSFLLIAGNGLQSTLVPLRSKVDGFPDIVIGLLGSCYFGGMLVGTFAAPLAIRGLGFRRAFLVFVVVAMAAALTMPALPSPAVWLVLRAATGFVFAGMYAVIEGWLSARSQNSNRGRIYALYQISTYAGSAAGQQALGLGPMAGATLFVAAALAYGLSLLPLFLSSAAVPRSPRRVTLHLWRFAVGSPIGAAAGLCIGAANGSFFALAPLFGLSLGFSTREVATFMTCVIVGTAVAIYPVAFMSDISDRRVVLLCCSALGAAAEALLARGGGTPGPLFWGLAATVGGTTLVLYTQAYSHATDRIDPEEAVIVSAAMLFLYCVGAVAAPVFASALMARFGAGALFVQNAVIHATLAIFVLWRMTRRPAAPRARAAAPLAESAGAPVPATRSR